MAQRAWASYNGNKSRNEFMSWYMSQGVARNKQVLRTQITKWDKNALSKGKKLTVEDICKILFDFNINRTPSSESSFAATIEKHIPGGIREYGEFKYGGTFHRPDFYVNKDIVFEYKIIHSNSELHTAIGQAMIYTHKYSWVFLIVFDARHGYDAVEFNKKEWESFYDKGIVLIKYPN